MTKASFGHDDKEGGGTKGTGEIHSDMTADTVPSVLVHDGQVSMRQQTCWYVWSILASIFCCLPCGLIGMVHAMIAKHEGEKGNFSGQKRRLYQAKCWTSWSIALGLLGLGLTLLTLYLMCPVHRYRDDTIANDAWMQEDINYNPIPIPKEEPSIIPDVQNSYPIFDDPPHHNHHPMSNRHHDD